MICPIKEKDVPQFLLNIATQNNVVFGNFLNEPKNRKYIKPFISLLDFDMNKPIEALSTVLKFIPKDPNTIDMVIEAMINKQNNLNLEQKRLNTFLLHEFLDSKAINRFSDNITWDLYMRNKWNKQYGSDKIWSKYFNFKFKFKSSGKNYTILI